MNRCTVVVAVATCCRKKQLSACLDSLFGQHLDNLDVDLHCVVVDNDDQGSARRLVAEMRRGAPFPLHYELEPRRGITYARNRLVEVALSLEADFIAFIDDDEVAKPDWLAELVRIITTTGADAVQGPVDYIPPPGRPFWPVCYKVQRHPEGERKRELATNNVIFRVRLVKVWGLRFDHRYALTGGSDSDFFLRSHLRGGVHLWTNRARVSEAVTPERQRLRWLLRRAFRAAAARSIRLWHNQGMSRAVGEGVLNSCRKILEIVLFTLLLPLAFLSGAERGRYMLLKLLRRVAALTGTFAGLAGWNMQEYRPRQDERAGATDGSRRSRLGACWTETDLLRRRDSEDR